jgi:acetone carboxylase gamma subunit
MSQRIITEYLAIDLETERWLCRRCQRDLGNARENYKLGLAFRQRDPGEIHSSGLGEPRYTPDPQWCRLVEMFCPGCATLIEVEYLPPGHPITYDIEIDIDALKADQQSRSKR